MSKICIYCIFCNAEYIGFSFHNDLWQASNEVLQSLASFNYSKCSLHAGPA